MSLSSIALLGPSLYASSHKAHSVGPSVVVAGTVKSKSKDRTFVIVYGLSANALSSINDENNDDEVYDGGIATSGTIFINNKLSKQLKL